MEDVTLKEESSLSSFVLFVLSLLGEVNSLLLRLFLVEEDEVFFLFDFSLTTESFLPFVFVTGCLFAVATSLVYLGALDLGRLSFLGAIVDVLKSRL